MGMFSNWIQNNQVAAGREGGVDYQSEYDIAEQLAGKNNNANNAYQQGIQAMVPQAEQGTIGQVANPLNPQVTSAPVYNIPQAQQAVATRPTQEQMIASQNQGMGGAFPESNYVPPKITVSPTIPINEAKAREQYPAIWAMKDYGNRNPFSESPMGQGIQGLKNIFYKDKVRQQNIKDGKFKVPKKQGNQTKAPAFDLSKYY